MRWLITLLIGVVGGFVLGAFTPASDYFSVDKLSGLISQEANSENEAEGTPELSIYERIDGAIAVVRDSAKDTVETVDQFGSILGQEAPGDWTMAHADVTRSPNSITQASIESGDANVPPEVAELVAMLNEAIREFKAHNEQLTADIETSDKGHPQHFYLKTLLHSNLSMITYSEYLIAVQAGDFTIQGLAQLQVSLDESKKEIENSSTDGTKASANWAAINKIMPAKSDGDRAVKALVNQFFSTYESSFANETALAAKLSEYPPIMAMSVASGGVTDDLEVWAVDFQKLAHQRVNLENTRTGLAQQILISAPTS